MLAAAHSALPSPCHPLALPLPCRQIKAPQAFSPGGDGDKASKRGRPPLPLHQKRREGDGMGGEDDSQQGQGQGKRGSKTPVPLDPEEVERRKREKEERVRKRREEVRCLVCSRAVVCCGRRGQPMCCTAARLPATCSPILLRAHSRSASALPPLAARRAARDRALVLPRVQVS